MNISRKDVYCILIIITLIEIAVIPTHVVIMQRQSDSNSQSKISAKESLMLNIERSTDRIINTIYYVMSVQGEIIKNNNLTKESFDAMTLINEFPYNASVSNFRYSPIVHNENRYNHVNEWKHVHDDYGIKHIMPIPSTAFIAPTDVIPASNKTYYLPILFSSPGFEDIEYYGVDINNFTSVKTSLVDGTYKDGFAIASGIEITNNNADKGDYVIMSRIIDHCDEDYGTINKWAINNCSNGMIYFNVLISDIIRSIIDNSGSNDAVSTSPYSVYDKNGILYSSSDINIINNINQTDDSTLLTMDLNLGGFESWILSIDLDESFFSADIDASIDLYQIMFPIIEILLPISVIIFYYVIARSIHIVDEKNTAIENTMSYFNHEIRNPLSIRNGYCEIGLVRLNQIKHNIMKNEYDIDNILHLLKDMMSKEETAYRAGKMLEYLVADMIDLDNLENGRLTISKTVITVQEIVEQYKKSVQYKMDQRKDIEYIFQIDEECNNLTIYTDINRMIQIFINFFNNADKYTETGSITFKTSINDNKIRFSIIDTGAGINSKVKHQIFKTRYINYKEDKGVLGCMSRFRIMRSDVDEPRTRKEGIGIGLYLCSKLAQELNASIGFQTELGTGSIFWIDIDIHRYNESVV